MRRRNPSLAEDRFWALIELMGGNTGTEGIDALRAGLRAEGRGVVRAFHERLARVLFELDREVLASQPVRFRDDPPGVLVPLSDDAFLYLRAAIVAAGRETYDAVLADPDLLARGGWDECEELLSVAPQLIGRDIETAVSYETGSNGRHWRMPVPPVREDWDTGPRPVIVTLRDRSRPNRGESLQPDGSWATDVDYPPPAAVDSDLYESLTVDVARAVVTGGGLPSGAGAVQLVDIVIDFDEEWRTQPDRLGPLPRPTLGLTAVLELRVEVPASRVVGWSRSDQRRGLLAVAAAALLTIFPEDHPALADLTALHEAGSDLIRE